mgnify:CR=1 FL=1
MKFKKLNNLPVTLEIIFISFASVIMFALLAFGNIFSGCAILLMIYIINQGIVIGSAWAIIVGSIGVIFTASLFMAQFFSMCMWIGK